MKAYFVTFFSPGTFFSETTTKPIDSWDVDIALAMSKEINERYGATPYGFRFTTRSREDHELDSKQTDQSVMYYIGGKIETLDDIRNRADPRDNILISNMECNGWDKVWTSISGWKTTQPLNAGDIVLAGA